MNSESLDAVLRQYGLTGAATSPLDGGAIHSVWRIDAPEDGPFALKCFTGVEMTPERLHRMFAAEDAVRANGVVVPETVPTMAGASYALVDGLCWVLSRFVVGRTIKVGEVSEAAARSMGVMLARLHEALSELPPGAPWLLPAHGWIEAHLRDLLAVGNKMRDTNSLDEKACRLLERKLGLLSKLPAEPPRFEPHWTHRDYTVRNLLFDEHDEVAAVLDFDQVRITSRGYEVMRCLDHGFPGWSREGLAFFESYAAVSSMTADDARACAELFCYVSAFSTWPMRSRYLQDEEYREHWEEFIRLPDHPWEAYPVALAECLASIVTH